MAHRRPVNLAQAYGRFSELWNPKIVAGVNDYDVKLVKVQGEFSWHTHAETDEFFLVLAGSLRIQMRTGDVQLSSGELFVVPKGDQHCPLAEEETHIEPRGTLNTGDVTSEYTVRQAERL